MEPVGDARPASGQLAAPEMQDRLVRLRAQMAKKEEAADLSHRKDSIEEGPNRKDSADG